MMLAHNVFFTLDDNSPVAVQAMIDDCHVYLARLPGILFYAAGTCSDVDRSVSDRNYDVALHVIFQDRAALDAYSTAPEHIEFIKKRQSNWKNIRIFDSDVIGA